jgi:hypothetical protein
VRFVAISFLLFLGVGCKGLVHNRLSSSEVPMGPGCVAGPQGEACPPPSCPAPSCPPSCPPKCPEKPKEEKREAQPREAPPVERTTSRASVTQDILLIPRMVYVPYAPQVPVAPARLGMVAPAERVTTEQQTTREPAPAPRDVTPPPTDRSAECLDKCAQMLERLDERLRALEERQRAICPPAGPACTMPMPTQLPEPTCPPGPSGPVIILPPVDSPACDPPRMPTR